MLASVSLLAPYGLLACLLALVPVAVVALAFTATAPRVAGARSRARFRAARRSGGRTAGGGVSPARDRDRPARRHDDDGALRPHLVRGRLRRRCLALDDSVLRPGRAHPPRPGASDRRGAARVRARRPGRAQRPHRSRPAVRLSDPRRAGLLRDAGAERASRSRRHRRRSRTSPRASSHSPPSPATGSTGRAPSIARASSSPTARRARTSRGTAAASSWSCGWGLRRTASTRRTAR